MRFMSMIAGGLLAPWASGAAVAQTGVETVATFRHEMRIEDRSWVYRDGALWGLEKQERSPEQYLEKQRLVRIDPRTSKLDVLTDFDTTNLGTLDHFTPTRIFGRSANSPRLRLYSRQPVEELTDIWLNSNVMDMIERDGELHMLQLAYDRDYKVSTQISRFNRDDLTYLGKIPLSAVSGVSIAVFYDGGIVGMAHRAACAKDMMCVSFLRSSMTGELLSSLQLEIKPLEDPRSPCRYYDETIPARTNDFVLFRVECTLYAVDSKAEALLYKIPLASSPLGVAVGDDFVFVLRSDGAFQPTPGSPSLFPLQVFDRRDGRLVTTLMRPQGHIAADGDKLIQWRWNKAVEGEVLRLDAKAMRR